MSENRNITVSPYPDNNACFMGVGVVQPCSSCHADTEKSLYRILIKDKDGVHDDNSFILCSDCLRELDEQIRHELNFTVNLNDTVWELTRCDDGKWHVFPMIVKNICQYGSPRKLKSGELSVWNIYAESDYTYMYKSFYDIGKTLFFTEKAAKEALKYRQENM
jgi:hypothetical protein